MKTIFAALLQPRAERGGSVNKTTETERKRLVLEEFKRKSPAGYPQRNLLVAFNALSAPGSSGVILVWRKSCTVRNSTLVCRWTVNARGDATFAFVSRGELNTKIAELNTKPKSTYVAT